MRLWVGIVASIALFSLVAGCSHHADHHARGEPHNHHAPHVGDVHDPYDAHHEDSDPDEFHLH